MGATTVLETAPAVPPAARSIRKPMALPPSLRQGGRIEKEADRNCK
jgi:hypothetical protein